VLNAFRFVILYRWTAITHRKVTRGVVVCLAESNEFDADCTDAIDPECVGRFQLFADMKFATRTRHLAGRWK
jgi:hypothetical protein